MKEEARKRVSRAGPAELVRGFEARARHTKGREYGVSVERAAETRETPHVEGLSRPEGAAQAAFLSPDALGIPRAKDLRMRAASIFENAVVALFIAFLIGALVPVIIVVTEQEHGLLAALLLLAFLLFVFLDVILKRMR